jgi:hypothetical protein
MDSNLKLLLYIVLGLLMFLVGYTLYFRLFKKIGMEKAGGFGNPDQGLPDDAPGSNDAPVSGYVPGFGSISSRPKYKGDSDSGGLKICPICLFKMDKSEMIKTTAFPPLTKDSKDRLMHIHGCVYCMGGKRERICPVCGKTIDVKDFLVARIFDRSVRRSHVHVLGCTQCRPLKTL